MNHTFEFKKFFSDPWNQSYLHIIKPITHIQFWKFSLLFLAEFFNQYGIICRDYLTNIPIVGGIFFKITKLVYEQIIFKLAGWIVVYLLAYIWYLLG